MNRPVTGIHTTEDLPSLVWPDRALDVARVGDAWVATSAADFDLDDLNLVRRQFTDRRVTLDGDVITVWPRTTTTP